MEEFGAFLRALLQRSPIALRTFTLDPHDAGRWTERKAGPDPRSARACWLGASRKRWGCPCGRRPVRP